MTIAVSFSRTMATAKRIVPDEEVRSKPRRTSVIELSLRWQREQEERRRRRERAWVAVIERARERNPIEQPEKPEDAPPLPREVIQRVAEIHRVGVKDVLGESRARHLVAARTEAMAQIYLQCRRAGRQYSLHEIGRIFTRDHTTVLHALQKRGLK